MDLDLMTGVLNATPQLAALSGMVILCGVLLRQLSQVETRHRAELERQAAAYDEDAEQLRAENDRLRVQRDAAEDRARTAMLSRPPPAGPAFAQLDPPTWPGRHRLDGAR